MNRRFAVALLVLAALTPAALAATPSPAEAPFCPTPVVADAVFPALEAPAPLALAGTCGTCGRIPSCFGKSIGSACTGLTGIPGVCEATGKICWASHTPECACF